jgi:hypothetical protein
VEQVGPLATAVGTAFERIRSADVRRCALLFEVGWEPTMDLVEIVVSELERSDEIASLVLVHPSSAMAFIATAITLRMPSVVVAAQRSIYDDPDDDENLDATESKTMFMMTQDEPMPAFVRRAVAEVRLRVVHRFALILDERTTPGIELADLLVEELLGTAVKEIGLIHKHAPLDTVAAALRLRLPGIRVSLATTRA